MYVLKLTPLCLFGGVLLLSSIASAHTLSGTIYGGADPLPNTVVTLTDSTTATQIGTDTTDASGLYSFTIDNGTYDLVVTPPTGSGFPESDVNDVVVLDGDVTQNVVLLQQFVTLSGYVYGSDGVTPAENVSVY